MSENFSRVDEGGQCFRPLFITFEGGEGAGKSTLMDAIEKRLLSQGFEVVKTREPGKTRLGEHVRSLLLDAAQSKIPIGLKAELLLFLTGRAQLLEEVIVPSLKAGKVVLCDRFSDSTVAYQGVARGLGVEYVEQLCNLVCGPVVPILTLFLDLDPQIGFQRMHNRQRDRMEMETLDFHTLVRQGFQALAARHLQRIVTVDASLSAKEVLEQSWQVLQQRLSS